MLHLDEDDLVVVSLVTINDWLIIDDGDELVSTSELEVEGGELETDAEDDDVVELFVNETTDDVHDVSSEVFCNFSSILLRLCFRQFELVLNMQSLE